VSKFSTFPGGRKKGRSLGAKSLSFFLFAILSGEVCKQLQNQATRKQAVLWPPLQVLSIAVTSASDPGTEEVTPNQDEEISDCT